jgi:sugar phosphate isomerase/epimerase
MRLGGALFREYDAPDQWVDAVRACGYRAAFCPVGLDASEDDIRDYAAAAQAADIVIAEVGAWSNPLSPDEATRTAALEKCKKALLLADRIGACCCVNIAGSRGEKWDGPCADDLTPETFEMIVVTVRDIIDTVAPAHTFYTLETMPWMYPDSAESYEDLIKAVDRRAFAVHLDPVNLICSPQRYFRNAQVVQEFVDRLGPHVKSCHAKDIVLRDKLTVHLDEVRPGCGGLDFRGCLSQLGRLDPNLPLMIEHLPTEEGYAKAADYIRSVARQAQVLV